MSVVLRPDLWERMLRADEAMLGYFAKRVEIPGAALFFAGCSDAPEFDVALIYRVPPECMDATLRLVIDQFQRRQRRPSVRLGPMSSPSDWSRRLQQAGFVETDERFMYLSVPETLQLQQNAAIRVERALSLADADRFSAIQIAGFDVPVKQHAWERALARQHLSAGQHNLYLAWCDRVAVGAGRSIHLAGGVTAMAALATLPNARGKGVGTSLLGRMIDDARAAGSRVIFGVANTGSYAAGMYERLGLVPLFEVRSFATSVYETSLIGVMEKGELEHQLIRSG